MNKRTFNIKRPIAFFSFDTLARAAYIGLSNNKVERTVRENHSLFFDYDKNDKLVGIEIIRIQKANATIKKILKDTEINIPTSIRRTLNSCLQPLVA
jgi:uncharacterized protein YuzE